MIGVIRIISALIFSFSFLMALMIYSSVKNKTTWFFVSLMLLVLVLESVLNAFEWFGFLPNLFDFMGEILIIIFFGLWVFLSIKLKEFKRIKA
jgi:hypothetical protein